MSLNPASPIVDAALTMSPQMREEMRKLALCIPIHGTGSPEGVVSAPRDQHYLDDSGGAGAILYIKMLADIGGDTSQGWVLA